jgi:hypothetical protein
MKKTPAEKTPFQKWMLDVTGNLPNENQAALFKSTIDRANAYPERNRATPYKAQLKKFSDAVENMDMHTKLELARMTAKRYEDEERRELETPYGKGMAELAKKHGIKRLTLFDTAHNPNGFTNFIIEVLNMACDVAFEESEKAIKKAEIARDVALVFVRDLLNVYSSICDKEPTFWDDSPFTKLVCIGLNDIGYSCNDPRTLIDDAKKPPSE